MSRRAEMDLELVRLEQQREFEKRMCVPEMYQTSIFDLATSQESIEDELEELRAEIKKLQPPKAEAQQKFAGVEAAKK